MKKRIIDKRVKEKFMMDDSYLNGYAKLCGWKATLVYISLCRHASKDQYCFPSIKLMATEHSISRDVIMDGIKILVEWNIIEVEKNKTSNGWKNNSYTLLDKSIWKLKPHQVADSNIASSDDIGNPPSRCRQPDQVAVSNLKETNNEGNKFKETHNGNASVAETEIREIMEIFYEINPTLNWKNKTIRAACKEMIDRFGLEKTKQMSKAVISIQGKPYAPTATTPYEMKEKLAKFKLYFERQKNSSHKFLNIEE